LIFSNFELTNKKLKQKLGGPKEYIMNGIESSMCRLATDGYSHLSKRQTMEKINQAKRRICLSLAKKYIHSLEAIYNIFNELE